MGVIKFAIKAGVVGYAVKYTVDEGVWRSADDAIVFRNKLCKAIDENEHIQVCGKKYLNNI